MGHLKCYSVGDAIAHFRRRHGLRVLHPMGYDAFGLPGREPRDQDGAAPARVHRRTRSPSSAASSARWGISIDWSREFGTHEPRYYRWTQWLFLRLFERGLAYRKDAAVNWCPKDETVLANEQAKDGVCERCGAKVEVRQLEQWFFKITDYADRLLDDLDDRRLAASTSSRCSATGSAAPRAPRSSSTATSSTTDYPVFTTRPDTLFGATFFVLAPEHPDVLRLNDSPEVREYVERALVESAEERGAEDRRRPASRSGKTVKPGQRGADPDLRRRLRADGVRHRRDHGRARARRARLRVRPEVRDRDQAGDRGPGGGELPYAGDGAMTNSGRFDGLAQPRGVRADRRLARRGRSRQAGRQLQAARLAALTPALLGLPDPDHPLRGVRPGRRCPTTSCRSSFRTSRTTRRRAARRSRRPRTGCSVDCPSCGGDARARDRHDGHLRRLLVVLPALLRRRERRGGLGPRGRRRLDAGRPVHRRGRARDPAPDVRALLRQGARGHGPPRRCRSRSRASSRRG